MAKLTFLSWNTDSGALMERGPGSEHFKTMFSKFKADKRIQKIIDTISSKNPDIFCLQESTENIGGFNLTKLFKCAFEDQYYLNIAKYYPFSDGSFTYITGIKKTVACIENTETVWFTKSGNPYIHKDNDTNWKDEKFKDVVNARKEECFGSLWLRTMSVTGIRVKKTGNYIKICNVHPCISEYTKWKQY